MEVTVETTNIILALVTGAVLPFVTTYLTRAAWPDYAKFVVVIVIAGIVGFVQLWATGGLPELVWENALAILGTTYLASAVIFWGLIDTTGLRGWLEAHGLK